MAIDCRSAGAVFYLQHVLADWVAGMQGGGNA